MPRPPQKSGRPGLSMAGQTNKRPVLNLPRQAAVRILNGVMTEHKQLSELTQSDDFQALAPEDRARSQRLATHTLRHVGRADRALRPHLAKLPAVEVLNILRLGLVEIAGLGAPVSLDGSVILPQRILFVDLGGDANDLSGGSRAAQFMLLRQAIVEARAPNLVMVHDERLLSPSGRQVLLDFLKNPGLIVFDVDRAADIRNVIRLVREEKLRAVIRGGSEAWRIARELAVAQIPVILDPLVNLPDSFDDLGATLENAARLRKAGVTVAISMRGSEVDDAGKARQAAGNAVAHGMPWADGLAAITRIPAEIFGIADRFGSIAVGRSADLVMWSGDPLEVSSAALLVLTNGTVQSLDSRHSALRDRYAERVRTGTAR